MIPSTQHSPLASEKDWCTGYHKAPSGQSISVPIAKLASVQKIRNDTTRRNRAATVTFLSEEDKCFIHYMKGKKDSLEKLRSKLQKVRTAAVYDPIAANIVFELRSIVFYM